MPKFKKSLTPTRTQNLSRSLDEMNLGIQRKTSEIAGLDNDIAKRRQDKADADKDLAARMTQVAEAQKKLDEITAQQKKATAK